MVNRLAEDPCAAWHWDAPLPRWTAGPTVRHALKAAGISWFRHRGSVFLNRIAASSLGTAGQVMDRLVNDAIRHGRWRLAAIYGHLVLRVEYERVGQCGPTFREKALIYTRILVRWGRLKDVVLLVEQLKGGLAGLGGSGLDVVLLESYARAGNTRECLELLETGIGEPSESQDAILALARAEHEQGRSAVAIERLRPLLEESRRQHGKWSERTLELRHMIAMFGARVGGVHQAVCELSRVFSKRKQLSASFVAMVGSNLAALLGRIGAPSKAVQVLELCLAIGTEDNSVRVRMLTHKAARHLDLSERSAAWKATKKGIQLLCASGYTGRAWVHDGYGLGMLAVELARYLPIIEWRRPLARLSREWARMRLIDEPLLTGQISDEPYWAFHAVYAQMLAELAPEHLVEVSSALFSRRFAALMRERQMADASLWSDDDPRRNLLDKRQDFLQRALGQSWPRDNCHTLLRLEEHIDRQHPGFSRQLDTWWVTAKRLRGRFSRRLQNGALIGICLPQIADSDLCAPIMMLVIGQSGSRVVVLHDVGKHDLLAFLSGEKTWITNKFKRVLWRPLQAAFGSVKEAHFVTQSDVHQAPFEIGAPAGVKIFRYPGLPFLIEGLDGQVASRKGGCQPGVRYLAEGDNSRPSEGGIPFVGADIAIASVFGSVEGLGEVRSRVLVISGHGYIADNPMQDAVLIGSAGRFDIGNALKRDAYADIVIVPVCNMATTRDSIHGEPLGLISAILAGGARFVVAALQPVSDVLMPILLCLLLQALSGLEEEDGSGIAGHDALAEAKRRLARGEWYSNTELLLRDAYLPVLLNMVDMVDKGSWTTGDLALSVGEFLSLPDMERLVALESQGMLQAVFERDQCLAFSLAHRIFRNICDHKQLLQVDHVLHGLVGFGMG